jgi:hypothetical protein
MDTKTVGSFEADSYQPGSLTQTNSEKAQNPKAGQVAQEPRPELAS